MLKKITLILIILITPHISADNKETNLADGIYANIKTNKGTILLELFYQQAPLTVINFAGLAMGSKNNLISNNTPYYDGLIFHRVIKNFMIQGGDPRGNGTGGPGYSFADEITDLKHNKAGILSMANSGANTNGSQFFITHKPTPHLDGKHTVFGSVVKGIDTVNNIVKGDIIKHIKIIKIGSKAQNFATDEAAFAAQLDKYKQHDKQKLVINNKEFLEFVKNKYPKAKHTKSGLYYIETKKGSGKQTKVGDTVITHYSLELANGKKIVSSRDTKKPISVQIGVGKLIKSWDEALLTMREGDRRTLIAPYHLAYGEKGVRGISPKATLIFDIELLEIK